MMKRRKKEAAEIDRQAPAAAPEHVVMVRTEEEAEGGPVSANVHPSEAAAWAAAGWKIKEKEKIK